MNCFGAISMVFSGRKRRREASAERSWDSLRRTCVSGGGDILRMYLVSVVEAEAEAEVVAEFSLEEEVVVVVSR